MEENNLPQANGKNLRGVMVILVILIILAGAFVFSRNRKSDLVKDLPNGNIQDKSNEAGNEMLEKIMENTSGEAQNTQGTDIGAVQNGNNIPSPTLSSTPEVKTFTVEARNFSFTPAEIKVKKGDRVKIIMNNTQGFHDIVIDEFQNARTKQISSPGMESMEFIADKSGSFEYYCSVGKHREMGMKGNLVVE